MPSYFPEGTTPRPTDSFERLLQKAASLVSARNGGADAPSPDDSRERTMYKFVRGLSASISESSNLDPDALAYAVASGAADVVAIDAFVKGVKALGLWNNMVCWPLRSRQNAGTGTVVHSLGGLGTFNGTLVGGPGWGANGITFTAASNHRITTPYSVSNSPKLTHWGVASSTATTGALIATVDTFNQEAFYISIRKTTATRYQYRFVDHPTNPAATITGTNTNVTGFASVGCGVQGATTVGVVNGVNDGSAASVPNRTGVGPLTIGGQVVLSTSGVTLPWDGTIAFAMSYLGSSDGLTTAQQLALHSLYKSTLGTGLGLP